MLPQEQCNSITAVSIAVSTTGPGLARVGARTDLAFIPDFVRSSQVLSRVEVGEPFDRYQGERCTKCPPSVRVSFETAGTQFSPVGDFISFLFCTINSFCFVFLRSVFLPISKQVGLAMHSDLDM